MATSLTNISNWGTAGFDRAQFVLSASGLLKMSDLSAGTGRGMTVINEVKAANWQFGEDVTVSLEGDDGVFGKITFEGDTLPKFDLTVSELAVAMVNAIQGTSIVDVQTTYDFLAIGPEARDYTDLFLMLTRRAVSTESGSEASGYETVIFPLCTLSFRGTGLAFQSAGEYTFSVTVNPVTQTPWGIDLSGSVTGKEKVAGFMFFSEAPPTFDVFKEDGVLTAYTLTQTIASNSQLIGFEDAGATESLGLSSNDATFTANSSGDRLTILYEVAV